MTLNSVLILKRVLTNRKQLSTDLCFQIGNIMSREAASWLGPHTENLLHTLGVLTSCFFLNSSTLSICCQPVGEGWRPGAWVSQPASWRQLILSSMHVFLISFLCFCRDKYKLSVLLCRGLAKHASDGELISLPQAPCLPYVERNHIPWHSAA